MQFDWALAMERNRRDLQRILRELFALAGLDFGTAPAPTGSTAAPEAAAGSFALPSVLPATLPRYAVLHIRRILRSAEAAVRRLIVIAARDIEVRIRHAPALKRKGGEEPVAAPAASRRSSESSAGSERRGAAVRSGVPGRRVAAPAAIRRSGEAPAGSERAGGAGGSGPRPGHGATPVTVTIRPEPPLPEKPLSGAPQLVRVPVNLGLANLRIIPDPEPEEEEDADGPVPLGTIPAFSLIDPRKRFDFTRPRRRYGRSRPRIRLLGDNPFPVYIRHPPSPEPDLRLPGDAVPAVTLLRRLVSARMALDNIDREARRLARHEARRRHRPIDSRKVIYTAMRPGPPPGYRKRNVHDIDEVLKECQRLAFWATKDDP
ncbi:hypothetical protein [Oricola thermophila]|uniref:Uncharacterized protein n=1 Tax=Oricola thermophila TaxID=2742145 RepID=A0A6N1VEL1_9HYPH|nr:hypothetical protein [Oricola thermophila]QKV17569.1 hypothetical protein HTY61_03325 [Oricola thermophila]